MMKTETERERAGSWKLTRTPSHHQSVTSYLHWAHKSNCSHRPDRPGCSCVLKSKPTQFIHHSNYNSPRWTRKPKKIIHQHHVVNSLQTNDWLKYRDLWKHQIPFNKLVFFNSHKCVCGFVCVCDVCDLWNKSFAGVNRVGDNKKNTCARVIWLGQYLAYRTHARCCGRACSRACVARCCWWSGSRRVSRSPAIDGRALAALASPPWEKCAPPQWSGPPRRLTCHAWRQTPQQG